MGQRGDQLSLAYNWAGQRYSLSKNQVDKFMSDQLSNEPDYKELFGVITEMLILSHSQLYKKRIFLEQGCAGSKYGCRHIDCIQTGS